MILQTRVLFCMFVGSTYVAMKLLNGEVYSVIEGGGYTRWKVYAITAGHDSTLYRPNCVFYFFFQIV